MAARAVVIELAVENLTIMIAFATVAHGPTL
jgi:hypothetical protein